jgi:hypothetical protein
MPLVSLKGASVLRPVTPLITDGTCSCSSLTANSGINTDLSFEGKVFAAAARSLRISLELRWHSTLSCLQPFAADRHDASVIELQLCPGPVGGGSWLLAQAASGDHVICHRRSARLRLTAESGLASNRTVLLHAP